MIIAICTKRERENETKNWYIFQWQLSGWEWVFEINSSSCHSVSVAEGDIIFDTIVPDEDGNIVDIDSNEARYRARKLAQVVNGFESMSDFKDKLELYFY